MRPQTMRREYEELIQATSTNKVAALAEVGYMPDVDMLAESHTPWGILYDLVQGVLYRGAVQQ